MTKRRITLLVILAMIFAVVLASRIFMNRIDLSHQRLFEDTLSSVDLSSFPDGSYEGSYSAFPVSAEVRVSVVNKRITNVEVVKHRHGQGAAAEAITDRVLKAQSLEVDLVTGASLSSKVILKAIEKALER